MEAINTTTACITTAVTTKTDSSAGNTQGETVKQVEGKKVTPQPLSSSHSEPSDSLSDRTGKINNGDLSKKKNMSTADFSAEQESYKQRLFLHTAYTMRPFLEIKYVLTKQLNTLLEAKHITKERFSIYEAALKNLEGLLRREIPDNLVWPDLDKIPHYKNIFCTMAPVSIEELNYCLLTSSPETPLLIKIQSWCLKYNFSSEIISKTFAKNLLACLSPLDTDLIELAAGSAMLSAAINKVGVNKRVLLTTDIKKPKENEIWDGVNYQQDAALSVVTKNKSTNHHMTTTYLALNPAREVIESLLNSKTPLFLINIGFSYMKPSLDKYNRSKLKILELKIEGFNTIECYENPICLLAINVPDNDYQDMIRKIPAQFLKTRLTDSRIPPSYGE